MTTIDLWADVACPWCYIGERRLLRVLREDGVQAALRWRPYRLQPDLPPGGVPWSDFVERKFGGWERARPMFAQVANAGAVEGIRFDFERVASSPNTIDAHRVILLGEQEGRLAEVAEAIYHAYFADGRDVGDREVLPEVAAGAGLAAERVRGMLAGEEFADEIRTAAAESRRLGIQGVPFFVFNGAVGFSGAQRPEVFRQALAEAA